MLDRRRELALGLGLTAGLASAASTAEPVKIAFVDTGNTGRSLMAETLARDLAARKGLSVAVISRGLDVDPFDEAPELHAQALMTERGFKVAGHVARPLTEGDVAHAAAAPPPPKKAHRSSEMSSASPGACTSAGASHSE